MSPDPGSIPMADPLAFFLTWTTYGSWLPGDERGWVEKPGQFCQPNAKREVASRRLMAETELSLDNSQREIVEKTIREHCQIRNWHLHALNCRLQHVHVVVTAANRSPDDVMGQFKSWVTRELKGAMALRPHASEKVREKWWTQGGSKRQLLNEASLEAAVMYVIEGQDGPFPHKSLGLQSNQSGKVTVAH